MARIGGLEQQGFNSLPPGDGGSGSSWMRRLCPLTVKELVDNQVLPICTFSSFTDFVVFYVSDPRLCRPLLFHLLFNRHVIRRTVDFLIPIRRLCRQHSVVQTYQSVQTDSTFIFDRHLSGKAERKTCRSNIGHLRAGAAAYRTMAYHRWERRRRDCVQTS